MKYARSLDFDQITLAPRINTIHTSRSQVDTSIDLGFVKLGLPIIVSPMDTVFSIESAKVFLKNKIAVTIPRYCSLEDRVILCGELREYCLDNNLDPNLVIMTIGLKEVGDSIEYFDRSLPILLDVANGYLQIVKNAAYTLSSVFDTVITGNVSDLVGYNYLSECCNGIRVGIGTGSVCTTTPTTGIGLTMPTSLLDISNGIKENDVLIIADGGIDSPGKIIKSLLLGADVCMVGSIFSGTSETPGKSRYINGKHYKEYRGMASKEAKSSFSGIRSNHVEGKSMMVEHKGDLQDVIDSLKEGLQSACSYLACNIENLNSLDVSSYLRR